MLELLELVMFPRTNRNFKADDIYLWLREYRSREGKWTEHMQDRLSLWADGSSENKTPGEISGGELCASKE